MFGSAEAQSHYLGAQPPLPPLRLQPALSYPGFCFEIV